MVNNTFDVYIDCFKFKNQFGVYPDNTILKDEQSYFSHPLSDADIDIKNNWKYVDENIFKIIDGLYSVVTHTKTSQKSSSIIYKNYFDVPDTYFLFHFPDEETALYFKLKFS